MLHPFPGPPRCFFLISPRHGPRVHPDPSRSTQDAYSDKELHLWSVAFSADSQQFAVATTHGVFVYSQAGCLESWNVKARDAERKRHIDIDPGRRSNRLINVIECM